MRAGIVIRGSQARRYLEHTPDGGRKEGGESRLPVDARVLRQLARSKLGWLDGDGLRRRLYGQALIRRASTWILMRSSSGPDDTADPSRVCLVATDHGVGTGALVYVVTTRKIRCLLHIRMRIFGQYRW